METGYVVKSTVDNTYYTGFNKWEKQLRKAKIYTSLRWAEEMAQDARFISKKAVIVQVSIKEIN